MYALWTVIGIVALWLAVMVVRAVRFKPPVLEAPKSLNESPDPQQAVEHLQQLIRCKTVSYRDKELEDETAFEQLYSLLPGLYPHVYQHCSCIRPNERSIIFVWKGRSSAKPVVLMAHYDVVPVRQDEWSRDAFAAEIVDGELWGRGTLDTKGTFNGVLQAADNLIAGGFVPANDLYLCFAGDEEVAGSGAQANVAWLKEHGIHPELVLDEGGAVVEKVFPGVTKPAAVIGIAEKGIMDIRLTVETKGGHASTPPAHSAIGMLSQAVARVEAHPSAYTLTQPVKQMFDTLARYSSFPYRLLFANLWCFSPVLNLICKKGGGELNALVRTTVAFTRAQGSDAYNVLPNKAWVGANLRIIPGDTPESCIHRLHSVIGDDRVRIERLGGREPSAVSLTGDEPWQRLENAVRTVWPDAVVTPYLMLACSDSCHYSAVSEHVYRFSAMALSREERGMIHGRDERIPLDTIVKTVAFYQTLIRAW